MRRKLRKVRRFGGVFPIDKLQIHISKSSSFVINLDQNYKEQSYRVAVNFSRDGRACYFDSFRREPGRDIFTFIERNAPRRYYCSLDQTK